MTTGATGGVELLRHAISGFGDSHPEAVRHYCKGDRVIEQGTLSDGFFLIIKGTVNILYRKAAGAEEQITLRWEHDLVGETAFVRPHALRTASVEVASEEATLIRVTRRDVFELLRDSRRSNSGKT